MFSRVLPNLLPKDIAKLRRKVIKKPWDGNSGPTCALRVFMSKFFRVKKAKRSLAAGHAAFKKLSPAQVQSLSKIAAQNMKQKKALREQVKSARYVPYALFSKRTVPAIYKAEKGNHKNRKACFRAVVKRVSAKYKKLSAAERKALSYEAARLRKKGKTFIETLVKKKK